ncbi:MAG: LuxR C-terminal-related transcriptional regulator [Myxococcales bacterium]
MTKDAIFRRLHSAIETVLDGRRFIDPVVAEGLALDAVAAAHRRARETLLLSPAEVAVLRACGRGLSNEEIAVERKRSFETVKAQMRSILEKLGVATREEAVTLARQRGII